MSEERAMQFKLRENRGRLLRPEFRSDLERILEVPLSDDDFLDVRATEKVRDEFFRRVKSASKVRRLFWRDGADELFEHLERVAASSSNGHDFYLLNRHDYYIGAVRVPAAAVLIRAQDVWRLVGEDLCLTNHDNSDGLCVEFNHYSDHDEHELTAWGLFADWLSDE